MKFARFFAVIFGIVGLVLMLGTTALCLMSLDEPVKLTEIPQGAQACSEEMMAAIDAGDFAAAAKRMYGQPDLGVEGTPADAAGAVVWNAYLESISYEFAGNCYATDSGLARDVSITTLDIPSVTEKLNSRASALLTQRVNAATEMAQLYDEENNFRADLVAEVLEEALNQAIAEDAKTVTREVTLNLIYRDGQWWVVPDQALLTALTGGVA